MRVTIKYDSSQGEHVFDTDDADHSIRGVDTVRWVCHDPQKTLTIEGLGETQRRTFRTDSYPHLFGPQWADFIDAIDLVVDIDTTGRLIGGALIFNGTQRIQIVGDAERIGY